VAGGDLAKQFQGGSGFCTNGFSIFLYDIICYDDRSELYRAYRNNFFRPACSAPTIIGSSMIPPEREMFNCSSQFLYAGIISTRISIDIPEADIPPAIRVVNQSPSLNTFSCQL
jgi:hypothetical protein